MITQTCKILRDDNDNTETVDATQLRRVKFKKPADLPKNIETWLDTQWCVDVVASATDLNADRVFGKVQAGGHAFCITCGMNKMDDMFGLLKEKMSEQDDLKEVQLTWSTLYGDTDSLDPSDLWTSIQGFVRQSFFTPSLNADINESMADAADVRDETTENVRFQFVKFIVVRSDLDNKISDEAIEEALELYPNYKDIRKLFVYLARRDTKMTEFNSEASESADPTKIRNAFDFAQTFLPNADILTWSKEHGTTTFTEWFETCYTIIKELREQTTIDDATYTRSHLFLSLRCTFNKDGQVGRFTVCDLANPLTPKEATETFRNNPEKTVNKIYQRGRIHQRESPPPGAVPQAGGAPQWDDVGHVQRTDRSLRSRSQKSGAMGYTFRRLSEHLRREQL